MNTLKVQTFTSHLCTGKNVKFTKKPNKLMKVKVNTEQLRVKLSLDASFRTLNL